MKLPTLSAASQSRTMTDKFLGYNANMRGSDGEWSDLNNMTSDYYPLIATRHDRGYLTALKAPAGITAKDAPIYVDGTSIYVNGYWIDMNLSTKPQDCPKQLVSMGAYLIIWPDKKYINTKDLTDYGPMGAVWELGNTVQCSYTMCKADGSSVDIKTVSSKEPSKPANGDYWIDTSQKKHSLKVWSDTSAMWISVATTYIKISAPNIGKAFSEGDGVTISGCTECADLNTTLVIQSKSDDSIIVIGLIDTIGNQTGGLKVSRSIPDMNYITESNNRLWGCYYGIKDGKMVNEIYASKLGDFKNFNCFAGTSTDSYAASLGTDGVFTGAVSYQGYPTFFKENYMHKVYGAYPAQYQITSSECRGVERGSYRSLCIINEVLYYKSVSGICAYAGALPQSISAKLGNLDMHEAVAGGTGNKLYMAGHDSKGAYCMYVYDTNLGIWHLEKGVNAMMFASYDNALYYIDAGSKKIVAVNNSAITEREGSVTWEAVTCIFGYDYPDHKYLSRFNLRMKLEENSRMEIFCEYDSSGNWIKQGETSGKGIDTFTVPVIPRRCDHMRIKFKGEGQIYIYSFTRILEEGSDCG